MIEGFMEYVVIIFFSVVGFCLGNFLIWRHDQKKEKNRRTDDEIQRIQDLEQAQIEKAYQLGYEEGKKDAQPERKKGKWEVTPVYIKCSVCDEAFMLIPQNYCPNCGADMRGKEEER